MKKKSHSRSSATDCSTKNSLLAKARNAWLESPEGKLCLGTEILFSPSRLQYLENRLKRAFDAGANATTKASESVAVATPDPCYRLTIENFVIGKCHLLEFHPTKRINQFRISVDGHNWSMGGWSKALAKIRKSCVRMRRYA